MNKTLLLVCLFSFNIFAIPNSIIAIVNDDLITFNQISIDIKPNYTKAQKLALVNQQIDLILQLQKIKQLSIVPKENVINSMLDNIALNNDLSLMQLQSLPQFDKVINHVKQNLSLEGLKHFIIKNLNIELTDVEISKQISKIPNHLNKLEKQIRIAQITINSIDQVDSDHLIKDRLIDLSERINKGDSFSILKKNYSQDNFYKNNGESNWLNLSKLPKAIQQSLKGLLIGEISQPFRIGQVWRIIKIIDKRSVNNYLVELKDKLIRQKEDTYFYNWVKKIRKEAYIKIFYNKL
ncbi:peptidylprolyl isomerase [Candidatus Vesicomyidisocius sp. SY067_SCS001]|uniref:peptidylprolyl isomerase n=1 Tax=Candidatus Vesicomyidisocius sp. SY067_SCS001 TaxID=2732590 RepID=UPI00168A13E1|nr:peptidylprolyl isomerase [Candidatus Vesicomyosocius sp. SY067_SCS001]